MLQRAQDWLADNDAVNLLEMLLWAGYKNVRYWWLGSGRAFQLLVVVVVYYWWWWGGGLQ